MDCTVSSTSLENSVEIRSKKNQNKEAIVQHVIGRKMARSSNIIYYRRIKYMLDVIIRR